MVSRSQRLREHDFLVAALASIIAIAALIVGSEKGGFTSPTSLRSEIFSWTCAAVLLIFGVVAARSWASGLGGLATRRTFPTAGAAVRLTVTSLGIVIVLSGVFALLGVSVGHLLIGAGLAGIVLGIAAQQTLGNVFAAVVLMLARPFAVGDRIRIRSGALGGNLDAWVLEVNLIYVTVRTDEGLVRLPNSAVLAAGIGQLARGPDVQQPLPGVVPDAQDRKES